MCWLFGFLCCNTPVDLVLGYLVVLSGLAQTYNEMFPCFPLTYSTVLIERDNCMTNWLSEQWELPPAHNSSTLQTVVHIHIVLKETSFEDIYLNTIKAHQNLFPSENIGYKPCCSN